MASLMLQGSLLLVQQHYNNKEGQFMLELNWLALHTADDAGMEGLMLILVGDFLM